MPRKLPPDFTDRLLALFAGPHRTSESIAEALGVSPATVHRHLSILRRSGHVIARPRGLGRRPVPQTPEVIAARLARRAAGRRLQDERRKAIRAARVALLARRQQGEEILDPVILGRRIKAWHRWQARRRRLGLPAAGKPYTGLARTLDRNERRAEA